MPAARLAQMIFFIGAPFRADLRALRSRRLICPRCTEKNHFHLIMRWARKLAQLLSYHASRSSRRPYGSATVRGVSHSATERAFRVLHLVSPASAWLGTKIALATPRRRQSGFCPSPRRRVTFAIPPAGTAVRRTKVRARCPERPPSR